MEAYAWLAYLLLIIGWPLLFLIMGLFYAVIWCLRRFCPAD